MKVIVTLVVLLNMVFNTIGGMDTTKAKTDNEEAKRSYIIEMKKTERKEVNVTEATTTVDEEPDLYTGYDEVMSVVRSEFVQEYLYNSLGHIECVHLDKLVCGEWILNVLLDNAEGMTLRLDQTKTYILGGVVSTDYCSVCGKGH